MTRKTLIALKSVDTIIGHIIDSEGRCNTPKEFTVEQLEDLEIARYFLNSTIGGENE